MIITLFENLPVYNEQEVVEIVTEEICEVYSNFGKVKENCIFF